VGQQHVTVNGIRVDKDVQLMKEFFDLSCDYENMSPIIIPQGYTKKYIDGTITQDQQILTLEQSFQNIADSSDCIVLEGTGHTGVGSVVQMNNAQVAARLGADLVMVCNGGLGSAFDELELNRLMCEREGVRLKGVILNKVRPDKLSMVEEYFTKLLKRWTDVPLLACIPDERFLGYPNLGDIERVFKTKLMSGEHLRESHYDISQMVMVATDLNVFAEKLHNARDAGMINPLLVTHCTRTDIILGFLAHYQKESIRNQTFKGALILSGTPERGYSPAEYVKSIGAAYKAPLLFAGVPTYAVMDQLRGFTPKLHIDDKHRVQHAIDHYEPYIDFDKLLA